MKKLFVFLLCLFVVGAIWWFYATSPATNIASTSEFVIGPGQSIRTIATNLQQKGLIKSAFAFLILVKTSGLEGKIQAGDFKLSSNDTPLTIAKNLTKGSEDVWITIPEGLRSEEISDIFQKKLPTFSTSWREQLDNNEGYLFPDTYLFPRNATVDEIIRIMKNNFNEKYQLALQQKKVDLTESQIVTLASIVEREAITQHDKQLVASVLENRLQIGMALGSDVTLEYALGYQQNEKTWWKKDLNSDDLALLTPYNTRLNAGLPPTPVSNPGLISLEAVVNPPSSNYFYYVSDKNGVLHFATTLEQHNANVARYGE